MSSKYIPRHNHVIVKKQQQQKTEAGIYVPDIQRTQRFLKLEIVHPGNSTDLHRGDIVWAEDMYESIDAEYGIIDSKFIHCFIRS